MKFKDRRFELKEVDEPVSGSTGKTTERRKRKRVSRYSNYTEIQLDSIVIIFSQDFL